MKKKRTKSFKVPNSFLSVFFLLIGFAAGFSTIQLTTHYQPFQEHQPIQQQPNHSPIHLSEGYVSVCFTPNKQCQTQILDRINKANKSIYVQGYSFTDEDIASALASANRRGVKVYVLLDKSNRNDSRSAKDIIMQNKIPLRFDSPSGIAHNKVIVLDEATVISGSYNFSANAYKRNTENLLILNNKNLAQQYLQNWHNRWVLSKTGENKHGQSLTN